MSVNPIIPGFAPDPSVVLVDGTFFLVTSTFHLFPGLPIYVSKDLVEWRQIGNAFNRREQMSLFKSETALHPQEDGQVMLATGGLFAPTIRYKDGTFYVICTNVIHPGQGQPDKNENFVLSTADIWNSRWSDPVWFNFNGIDPSICFGDDGKVYITGSYGPGPWTKVHMFEMDLQTGKKLTEQKEVWAGTGGIYPEGPHVYKREGMYYLLISEGGTFDDHMIVVARSDNIWGPYQACGKNPILTARGTNEYIQFTGHCDMFDDAEGNAWGVCLGVRKAGNRFIMGRETFITSGRWENGWPALDLVKSTPQGLTPSKSTSPLTADPLVSLLHIRDADLSNYSIADEGRSIKLTGTEVDLSAPNISPSFVGRRQRKLEGTASVSAHISGQCDVKAGLASYQDEHRYVRLYLDKAAERMVFECRNNAKKIHRLEEVTIQSSRGRVAMRMTYSEEHYELQFRGEADGTWQTVGKCDTLELTGLDFVGPITGVFAVSKQPGSIVDFRDLTID